MLLTVIWYLLWCSIPRSYRAEIPLAKCCQQNFEVIKGSDDKFTCQRKNNTRLEITIANYLFSNDSRAIEENAKEECVDSDSRNFFVYNIDRDSQISSVKEKVAPTTVFPKCCPLKHVYDRRKRACILQDNSLETYVENRLLKIGLSHCQIIVDDIFKNLSEAEEAFEVNKKARPNDFCMDKDLEDNFLIRECRTGLELCETRRCYKKCCPDGQSYVGGGFCRDTFVHGIQLESQGYSPYIDDIEDNYELIYGAGCRQVSILAKNSIQYTIKKGGEFRFYRNFTGKFEEHHYSQLKSYCLEHATKGTMSGYHIFLCLDQNVLEEKFSHTLWAKVLSAIFLLVTMVVYFVLGETKSTFGKILINYCLAMICLMVILIVSQVSRRSSGLNCKIRAYLLIFFNMSAFAWVNVMSLDIWWTFGTPRRTIGSDQRKKDLKKFFLYFLYGWGMPLCHTLLTLLFSSTRILPESIHPYVGIFTCFVEKRNYARTVLLLIPQLIFQIINTVFFIKTIVYCVRVKNEISKMNDTTKTGKISADKERLVLIVKLAVIMGVIWIFEVTTAFFDDMKSYSNFTKILEIIMDTITCLQGVFIFLIFICKKKTFKTFIKTKFGLGRKAKDDLRGLSMSVTQTSDLNGHYPMNKRQTTMSINDGKI